MPYFILLLSLLFISCEDKHNNNIKLGAILPLSGDFAQSGNYIRSGIKKAVNEFNGSDFKVKVIFEDAVKGKETLLAYNRLKSTKKIDVVISNYSVIGLSAVKERIEKDKIHCFQTSVLPKNYLKNSNYIHSSLPSINTEAKVVSNYLKNVLKKKRIAILHLNTPWGIAYKEAFSDYYLSNDNSIVSILDKEIGKNDFKTEITKIKAKNPDALFIAHFGHSLSNILREIKKQKLSLPIVGVQEAFDKEVIASANKAAEGFEIFIPKGSLSKHPLTHAAYRDTKIYLLAAMKCKKDKDCITQEIKRRLKDRKEPDEFDRIKVKDNAFLKSRI